MNRSRSILILILIGVLSPVRAGLDSVNDSLSIADFIAIMEEKDFQFYFNPEILGDSLRYPLPAGATDEEQIRTFFRGPGSGVYLRGRDVFLTGSHTINEHFAAGYYKGIRESVVEASGLEVQRPPVNGNAGSFEELRLMRFGNPGDSPEGTPLRLSGKVLALETGEAVIGATLQVTGRSGGTATATDGTYSLNLPAGMHEITLRAIGRESTRRKVAIYRDGELNVSMAEEITEIGEVVIVGKTDDPVNAMAGTEKLNLAMVKKSILVMGETDILKGILSMPGVQTITEVSNGFNVRGGSTDQNLVLLNEAPVMNSSHFFGFFSAFNADLVEEATLYKSGIPAGMGGRISSVLDVRSRTGSKEKFGGSAGISPVTARATLEGPVIKDRVSFIAGGRSTYSDWLLNRIDDARINQSSAWFYDAFGNIHASLGENTRLGASLYHSNDYFDFDAFLSHRYSNLAGSLSLDTRTGPRSSIHTALIYSKFDFSITDKYNPSTANRSSYSLSQYGLRSGFTLNHSRWLKLMTGVDAGFHGSDPGNIEPEGEGSLVSPVFLERENAMDLSPYIQNQQSLTPWLTLTYGIRYSIYGNYGPGTVFLYAPEHSKSLATLSDTLVYGKGEQIYNDHGPELRFLARVKVDNSTSLKFSYMRMRQYINLISNTITPAPTDIWKLSDNHFKPQVGDQYSLAFFRDLVRKPRKLISLSLETYYKKSRNILDYKVGADLFANEHFETEIMRGENRSYGVELQLIKEGGSFYGWASYTWARSENRFNSPFPEENINQGTWFPSNHDKPHQVKAILNYDFYRRLSLSANLNYSSGRPVTLPATSFWFAGSKRIQFAERNTHRMPDYFRLDISATLDGRYQLDKPVHGSFTLSLVNVTGRKNPYSVFFQYDEKGRLKAYYLSIFGVPILTLSYNLKF